MPDLRSLPSVDALLQTPAAGEWIRLYGRPLTLQALRGELEVARRISPAWVKSPGRRS